MRLRGGRVAAPTHTSPCHRGIAAPTLSVRTYSAGAPRRCLGRVLSPVPVPHIEASAASTALSAGHRRAGHASGPTPGLASLGRRPGRSVPSLEPPQGPAFLPSEQQQRAIDAVLAGRNVFLTGCAGTGKSATLNALRRHLESRYGTKEEYDRRVAVVAMTGLAATLVGGVTLNSLLKLRLCEQFRDLERMISDDKVLALLLELDTLIVDEASMMSAELLQALDHYLTVARKRAAERFSKSDRRRAKKVQMRSDRPFGGLQMVLSGDFFQLGPIVNSSRGAWAAHGAREAAPRSPLTPLEQPFLNRGFLFEAPVFFGYGAFECIELEKVFRQEDGNFVALLNAIRCGTDADCDSAKSQLRQLCGRPLDDSDGIMPTLLYSRNDQVRDRNERELDTLPEALVELAAVDAAHVTHEPPVTQYAALVDSGLLTQTEYDKLVPELEAEVIGGRTHESKLGSLNPDAARVAKELRRTWRKEVRSHVEHVAGRSGLFRDCQAAEKVQLKEGAQVMLVWNMDLDCQLANGSRGVVTGFDLAEESLWRECIAMAEKHQEADCGQEMRRWLEANPLIPRVRFTNGEQVSVRPAVFTAVVAGYGVSVRVQMPLKLAWAVTVHKSQGMTLDKVIVDMSRFFGHGMLYTALSRARGLEGLQLIGDTKRTMNPQVWQWWQMVRAGGTFQPAGQQQRHPVWCWMDSQQLVAGKPQNGPAEAWFRGEPLDEPTLEPLPPWEHQQPQLPEGQTAAARSDGSGDADGSSGDGAGRAGGNAVAQQGAGQQPAASASEAAEDVFSSLPQLVDAALDIESGLKRLLARKGAVTKADVSELLAQHTQLVSALEDFEEWRRGREAYGRRRGVRPPARGGGGG